MARAPTYRLLWTTIQTAYLTLVNILRSHEMPLPLREELTLLANSLDRLLARDNGRNR